MNSMMNRDYTQLNVLYISTMIMPIIIAEASISDAAIQAAVVHIMGSYSCTYGKA